MKTKLMTVGLPLLALGTIASGWWFGLFVAPPDREMGDVQRLMYVHVPAMWMALLCVTLNFFCCITYLVRGNTKADLLAEASAEVGLVLGAYGLILGAIWGRPTWGVYWTWDPRLTSAAVMVVVYAVYVTLRAFVDDPEKRATWSAVAGILFYVDIPIVWFSVRWWKGLHQIQSTPKTVDPEMTLALRWNAFGLLFAMIAFLYLRYRIAQARTRAETSLPAAGEAPRVGLSSTGTA